MVVFGIVVAGNTPPGVDKEGARHSAEMNRSLWISRLCLCADYCMYASLCRPRSVPPFGEWDPFRGAKKKNAHGTSGCRSLTPT